MLLSCQKISVQTTVFIEVQIVRTTGCSHMLFQERNMLVFKERSSLSFTESSDLQVFCKYFYMHSNILWTFLSTSKPPENLFSLFSILISLVFCILSFMLSTVFLLLLTFILELCIRIKYGPRYVLKNFALYMQIPHKSNPWPEIQDESRWISSKIHVDGKLI